MPDEISIEEKQIKEDNAMKIILSSFPDKIALLYSNMWKEYCLNQTKEAGLVKQLDKVEMFLQANQYLKNGYSYESLSQFLQILDNIGVAVEEEDNSKFQSTLANMLKHLR
jgi:5'-deoxynucleotidase YfbR-like HD superfamily hydrolase